MQKAFIILLLITAANTGICQDYSYKPAYSMIFKELKNSFSLDLNIHSRNCPRNIKSYWIPSQSDVDKLETNFKKILLVKTKGGDVRGDSISSFDRLKKYAFQYVGVIIKNKKYIYINAYPDKIGLIEKRLVAVRDGGNSFWGALFSMEDATFSELAFNGSA